MWCVEISGYVFLWQSYKKIRYNDMYRYLFVIDSIWSLCAASVRFCSSKLYICFCNEETKTDYRVVFSCSIRHFLKEKS